MWLCVTPHYGNVSHATIIRKDRFARKRPVVSIAPYIALLDSGGIAPLDSEDIALHGSEGI